MKKFIFLICFAALISHAPAAVIQTVSYIPVPSGRYDKLYITGALNAGSLNIYKLEAQAYGTFSVLSRSLNFYQIGTLNISSVPSIYSNGYIDVGQDSMVYFQTNKSVFQMFDVPPPSFNSGSKIVAWRAWSMGMYLNASTQKDLNERIGPFPSGTTLRWVQITEYGSNKKYTVLAAVSKSSSTFDAAVCTGSFSSPCCKIKPSEQETQDCQAMYLGSGGYYWSSLQQAALENNNIIINWSQYPYFGDENMENKHMSDDLPFLYYK